MIANEDNRPDNVEISHLNAEVAGELARRKREGIREATPEKWDRMNEESIARGDGPLPF